MPDTVQLLDMSVVTYEVRLSDIDLKARLERELLGGLGLLDDTGKPKPGVTATVLRYGERPRGGYNVRVTRDMSKSTDKALPAPGER